jgi:hypothetical protein
MDVFEVAGTAWNVTVPDGAAAAAAGPATVAVNEIAEPAATVVWPAVTVAIVTVAALLPIPTGTCRGAEL